MDSILSSFLVLCLHVLRGFSSTSMDTKHHDAAYNITPANTKTSLKHSEIKTPQLSFSSFFPQTFPNLQKLIIEVSAAHGRVFKNDESSPSQPGEREKLPSVDAPIRGG